MDLDSPLQTHVNGLVKREIISSFWGVDNTDLGTSKENFELKQYFGHYTAQSDLALHDLGRYVSARTHRDIIGIVDLFKQVLVETRSSVVWTRRMRQPDFTIATKH